MSYKKKAQASIVYHIYNERDHLRYPIPEAMEIRPIGKALTQEEWTKFCKRVLTPKLLKESEHKLDGTTIFHGEGGLDAATLFQQHFKDRFHLRMICASKARASEGLRLAKAKNLIIDDVHYKNGQNEKVMVNDPNVINELCATVTWAAA